MKRLEKEFVEKIESIYSKSELKIIEKGFSSENPTVFRINNLKDDYDVLKNFEGYEYELKKIDYLSDAYEIVKDGTLKLSLMKSFKKGYIYVQGITSQIPVELIDIKDDKDFKVLDITAAPGGKTTQIAAKMSNNGEIIANELNTVRYEKLDFTVKKQSAKNIKLIKADANNLSKQFISNYFDVIIADLPCSAEGRINLEKEKTYKFLEKPGINKRNYKSQQEILKNNIALLKVGGQLIYSTCTLDPLENEGIVHYILSNFPELEVQDISEFFKQDGLKEISKAGIKKYKKYIFRNEVEQSFRILPSEKTEGFFVVKFRKKQKS